jgi:hypothetical protein
MKIQREIEKRETITQYSKVPLEKRLFSHSNGKMENKVHYRVQKRPQAEADKPSPRPQIKFL